jgi:RND family efflux transporter MFP subunit
MANQSRIDVRLGTMELRTAGVLLVVSIASAAAHAQTATPTPAASPPQAVGPGQATVQGALAPQNRSSRSPAVTIGCLISPMRVADLGAAVTGVLEKLHVETGDTVRAGQVLATLRRDVESAAEQVARERLNLDGDLRVAEANLALATERRSRAEALHQEGFVSSQAVEQAGSEHRIAVHRLSQARSQRQVLARELQVVSAQVSQRSLRAPFDGVVLERYRQVGERIEERPIFRLAQLDTLRVDLVVPAQRWGDFKPGDLIRIHPELPRSSAASATVTQVDRVIDAASNTFRIRLSLPNPGQRLPAGARCTLDGDVTPRLPAAGDAEARSAHPRLASTATASDLAPPVPARR